MGFGHGLTVEYLGSNIKNGEQDQGNVIGHKNVDSPVTLEEDFPAREDTDQETEYHSIPSSIGLEFRGERERGAVESLRFHPRVETEISEGNTEPSHQPSDGGHVRKPAEDPACATAYAHVGQGGEEGAKDDGDVWQSRLGHLAEDLGCISSKSKSVKRSGRSVQIGAGSGPGRSEKSSVDHGRQSLDASGLDSNNEGRCGSITSVQVQIWVVGWDEQTNDQGTTNVEQEDTDVDSADGLGQVATRVLGLTGSDGHNFGSNEGEGGLSHNRPPPEELTLGSSNASKLNEWTRMLPVPEADAIMVGASTQVEDNT